MEQNTTPNASPSSSDKPADVALSIENSLDSKPLNIVNGQNVQKVLNFLQNPSVNPLNYESNYSFLRSKGITDHEIQTAYSHLGRNKMIDQKQAPVLIAQQSTVSIWSRLRDIANLSVLLYFLYKAARHLFMFYIKPWFTGVPKSSEESTTAETAENNAVLPCQCENETTKLNQKIVAMQTEMNSMKTLLLSNISTTTASIPKVIPRWQQNKTNTEGGTTSETGAKTAPVGEGGKVPPAEEVESSPPKVEVDTSSPEDTSSVLSKEDT